MMQGQGFWNDQKEAAKVSQRVSGLKEKLLAIESIKKEFQDLAELSNLSPGTEGLEKIYRQLDEKLKREELRIFLSGLLANQLRQHQLC